MWEEARDTLGVHAYHAAVMLCRKILFHIAVEKGLGEAGKDGFAPNFTACINHLRQTQVITGPMQAWVNRIKDVGGEANHQIRTTLPKRPTT